MNAVVWLLILANLGLGVLFLTAAAQEWMDDNSECVYGFMYAVVFLGSATMLASGVLG